MEIKMKKSIGFIVTTQTIDNQYNVCQVEVGDLDENVYNAIIEACKSGNTDDVLRFISEKFPTQTVIEFDVVENGFDGTILDNTLVMQ